MNSRVIAYYLPQYHPVEENDKFWGKGFTEWRNVAKATPLFKGHQQPNIPTDLGFYDLRIPEIRKEQAELAREAGIEGFCYWHYWFGNGKKVLDMPFNEVVRLKEPEFPFCLGWANHDWTTKTWDSEKNFSTTSMIFKQDYPGDQDYISHFYSLLEAFSDERYIKVDGKLLFVVFKPDDIPNANHFIELWNDLAKNNGLNGFHFVAIAHSLPVVNKAVLKNVNQSINDNFDKYYRMGFDAVNSINQKYAEINTSGILHKAVFGWLRKRSKMPLVEKYSYSRIMNHYFTEIDKRENVYPQLWAGWDRTPRSGKKAIVYYDATPENFELAARKAVETVEKKENQHRIIFLNSWNEWGEGAYMEPDLRYGKGKINALKKVLNE